MKAGKFIILVMFILIAGCREDENSQSACISGNYSYSAYNTSGKLVVKGTLKLQYQDSSNISGEWDLSAVSGNGEIGPQTGKGHLNGGISEGFLAINLNPNYVDNNVILRGKIDNGYYSGEWIYVTFAGPSYHGTFEARKKAGFSPHLITGPEY